MPTPYIVQQTDSSGTGLFPAPTTPGNFIVAGSANGNGYQFAGNPPVPDIGAFSDNGGNPYAATVGNARSYEAAGGSPTASVAVGASWTQVQTPCTLVSNATGADVFAYELGGVIGLDSTASGAPTGSVTTNYADDLVYVIAGVCLPGGSISPGFALTALNRATYSLGFAGMNDSWNPDVGAAGTYSLGGSGFICWAALAFQAGFGATVFPSGVSAAAAENAPSLTGNASSSPSGVGAASREGTPVEGIGVFPPGVAASTGVGSPQAITQYFWQRWVSV
jgi:hypothetical protein